MEIRMASQFSSNVRGQKTMQNCLKNYKGKLFKIQNITQPNYGQMENFKNIFGHPNCQDIYLPGGGDYIPPKEVN